jgi:hypothetical protein
MPEKVRVSPAGPGRLSTGPDRSGQAALVDDEEEEPEPEDEEPEDDVPDEEEPEDPEPEPVEEDAEDAAVDGSFLPVEEDPFDDERLSVR